MSVTGPGCDRCNWEGSIPWGDDGWSRIPCSYCSPWVTQDPGVGFMTLIYDSIAHGDEKHREWLRVELMKFAPQLRELLSTEIKKEVSSQISEIIKSGKYGN